MKFNVTVPNVILKMDEGQRALENQIALERDSGKYRPGWIKFLYYC